MSALSDVASWLRCPRCADPVEVVRRSLRCAAGHSFDLARQGYVNLLTRPAGAAADDAAMVAARTELLESGAYSPVVQGLVSLVRSLPLPAGGVVDVGAGTGHYTAAVLDALRDRDGLDRDGLAVDLSAYAARRAARAHPRLAAVVGDVWDGLPVRDGAAALVLDVFAPRNAPEFARVLAPAGQVVVVTPAPEHLHELVEMLGLPQVDPHKAKRLARTFAGFVAGPTEAVRTTLSADGATAARLARMGPGAHHADPDAVRELETKTVVEVTLAVDVAAFTRP